MTAKTGMIFFKKFKSGGRSFLGGHNIYPCDLCSWKLVIVIVLFQITTNNEKEKVRYVKFDRLGHQLITGIANLNTLSSRGTDRYTN